MESIDYPLHYQRIKTREVRIGPLKIGADHPICLQSMLTSSTLDIPACLEEIKSLVEVDCRLIRLTIPSRKDLDAVHEIRRLMKEEGVYVPLVADIHFSPSLAVDACELFEKVRINPGNYTDIPKSGKDNIKGDFFKEGTDKLREAIKPLVLNLKKYQRALRIGVNQGSLSSRMMERYGDTPVGMVASALEMIQLFEEQAFDQIIVSLKSSNPLVVQKAYRLLVKKLPGNNSVPLHLGVTEAGSGIMGRIKSLAGIGVLLNDGIGDTIRVSLTEPSPNEIIFARKFLNTLFDIPNEQEREAKKDRLKDFWERPITHQRVENKALAIGKEMIGAARPIKIGVSSKAPLPKVEIDFESDFYYRATEDQVFFEGDKIPLGKLFTSDSINIQTPISGLLADGSSTLFQLREFYQSHPKNSDYPVGMMISKESDSYQEIQLAGMLSEGLLDFLLIPPEVDKASLLRLLYLLQSTRSKILTTDYIICPSCGRTLFDIQSTAKKIQEKTSHLKGLKIGIMGCIVNGPGEMADADFGYVGSGSGKVDLYFGQERVRRNIEENSALDQLIALIKEKGYWKE